MTVLAERILDCFPSGSYALTALLRLMDVVESDKVPTAAVECRIQPRLLINPGFVERHAETPEKLLMLVMHELHHVLLGHTRLFPCITQTQNFVFDCVINALISRMFPEREHTAFLTEFYSDKRFPECLLRPPTRWNGRNVLTLPKGIRDLSKKDCRFVGETYRALYSDSGATYHEVYEVLPKLVPENALGSIPLLGGHDEEGATTGDLDHYSPVLFDIVRGIVEKWPQPPDPIQGRSLADIIDETTTDVNPVPSNRTILRTLLRKVGNVSRGGRVRRVGPVQVPSQTPIPVFDRRSVVLQGLGVEPLLHRGFVSVRRRTPLGERVHVYLDVSGSMDGVKGALYGAILDCKEFVDPTVHLFSTEVSDISLEKVRQGVVRSTGGTDIACVASHLAKHKIRRACVVTDGWVGCPAGYHFETLAGVKLAVAYLGDGLNTDDLAQVANHVAHLGTGE